MKLKKIDNIIIFGGTINALKILAFLQKTKYESYLFTSIRMLKEIVNEKGTLEKNLNLLKINYFIEKDINKSKKLEKLIMKHSLGIGIAEPWKFNKKIIKKFNSNLIDYMGIPLPRFRGGAHFSWMIMQNEKINGACFQEINEKSEQGVYDSGDKIEYLSYKNNNNKKPIDFFNKEAKIALKIFKKLLHKIENKKNLKYEKINEINSFFLPRLNTNINGWVNWQVWNTSEIINFINAFSFPYKGASTYINKKRLYLRNAKLYKKEQFHTYQTGLVTRSDNRGIYVITKNGIILIVDYNFNKKNKSHVKVGQRLFTPSSILEKALSYIPTYSSKGLKK